MTHIADYTPPAKLIYRQFHHADEIHRREMVFVHAQGALLQMIAEMEDHAFFSQMTKAVSWYGTWAWYEIVQLPNLENRTGLKAIAHQWEIVPATRMRAGFGSGYFTLSTQLQHTIAKRLMPDSPLYRPEYSYLTNEVKISEFSL